MNSVGNDELRRIDSCISTVYTWTKGQDSWMTHTTSVVQRDASCLTATSSIIDGVDVSIIVAHALRAREKSACRKAFSKRLGVPEVWWRDHWKRSAGYFGSDTHFADHGKVSGIVSWARYQVKIFASAQSYDWYKINMLANWNALTGRTLIAIFDPLQELRDKVPESLFRQLPSERELCDPYWMYPRILEDIASVQNTSVWDVRGLTRKAEQKREMYDSPLDMQGRPEPNFHRFHEIARHAIHGTETLDTAIKTTQHMIEHHATFQADMCESLDAQLSKQAHRMIHERLKAYQTFFEAQLNRAISNKDRLQNEIKLSFNRVAQYDAGHSLEIAKAARDDSESMSTIGFVTMLFLPATFVAAIFSTSFFSFEPGDGWQVSSEFWRYWAFALPITALTGASWLCRRVLWETWNTFLGSCRFPFSQTDKAAK